jgi:hypothetical protein
MGILIATSKSSCEGLSDITSVTQPSSWHIVSVLLIKDCIKTAVESVLRIVRSSSREFLPFFLIGRNIFYQYKDSLAHGSRENVQHCHWLHVSPEALLLLRFSLFPAEPIYLFLSGFLLIQR